MSFDEALEELLVQMAPFHSSWLFLESAELGATKPFFLSTELLTIVFITSKTPPMHL